MNALDLLLSRDSAPQLTAPAPNEAELDVMFQSAVRAPDHGRLRPWQFVIVPTEERKRFGEVLAESMRRRAPGTSTEMLERERDKAMRAPVIVVVAARVRTDRKIPAIEQICSAAAAAQNIMLAAHAQGYGAIWKTGAPAYDAGVKQALGLMPDDEIIGFLYLGTRVDGASNTTRPIAQDHVSTWSGNADLTCTTRVASVDRNIS
jgi:nitroreductase